MGVSLFGEPQPPPPKKEEKRKDEITHNWGLFKIKVPGNGPFAGLSRSFRGPMFSFRGDKPVLKNLFPSPNEGSTMYSLCFKSFRVPFAMQCFPFALNLQNLPLLNFKTGNLERLPIDVLLVATLKRRHIHIASRSIQVFHLFTTQTIWIPDRGAICQVDRGSLHKGQP